MKITRRGIFGLIAGAIVGTKAKPLIRAVRPIPGGEYLRYPAKIIITGHRPRLLKAKWTMELAKDLKVLHGIDPNVELTLL